MNLNDISNLISNGRTFRTSCKTIYYSYYMILSFLIQSMYEDIYNYVFLRSSLGTYFQYENAMEYLKNILASITLER